MSELQKKLSDAFDLFDKVGNKQVDVRVLQQAFVPTVTRRIKASRRLINISSLGHNIGGVSESLIRRLIYY